MAGLGEKFEAGVLQAPCQGEAGCALGDQGPMPRALPAGDLISRRVEGQRGRAQVAGGPGPLGLQQPQQVQEIHGRVFGASAQPDNQHPPTSDSNPGRSSAQRFERRQQSKAPQQTGHRGHIVAEGKRQRLHRRGGVSSQARQIIEDRGRDRAAEMSIERHRRVVGVPVDGAAPPDG